VSLEYTLIIINMMPGGPVGS